MSSVQIAPGDIVITQLPYHAGYSVGRVTNPRGPTEQHVPLGITATESAAVERARGMAAGRRVWLQVEDGDYAERTEK
jgi:hypothetical protein